MPAILSIIVISNFLLIVGIIVVFVFLLVVRIIVFQFSLLVANKNDFGKISHVRDMLTFCSSWSELPTAYTKCTVPLLSIAHNNCVAWEKNGLLENNINKIDDRTNVYKN